MPDRTLWLVILCFLLSGFAALIYQTAWTREFAFVFGTSELAVATVLAAYMGGLALGSAVAARLVGRVRRPVLVYGALEGGIAAAALAVPLAIRVTKAAYLGLLGSQPDLPSAGGGVYAAYFLLSSFAILMVPTALMGATLPLLARHVVHSGPQIGPRIGALYAVNTSGAVAGTLCAAFWLLPALGLRATVWVAVGANLVVLAIAVAIGRRAPPVLPSAPGATPSGPRFHWVLPAVLLSGIVSFTYEVFWFRLLSHALGGSVHAFATMLASFLIGIVLGSALAARLATDPGRAARGFAVAQLGIALLSLAAYAALDNVPGLAGALTHAIGRHASDALVSIAVLLPSTLCIGATFPFAVRALARGPEEASGATARVYAWNTVGAIVGAVGSGFWLIPALGFPGTLVAAVLASATLAVTAALAATPRSRAVAVAAVAVAALLAVLRPQPPWRLLRTGPVSQELQEGTVAYHGVGRTATVLLLDEGNQWTLRTNGLPESSVGGRHSRTLKYGSDRWLGVLPALTRPATRDMLVIGLGGGLAVELIPPSVERVDVVEIEPQVIEANRYLSGKRRFDPLGDPRLHLHVNDARGALELTDRRFDAITSQPSHPWTAGASHLYTREFFRLAQSHLRPGGVLVQWMGMPYVDADLLATLLATIQDTFSYVRVYMPYGAPSLLFVASDQPIGAEQSAAAAIAAAPAFYDEVGIRSPLDVAAALILDEGGVRRRAAGAPISTDDHNLLETRSPGVTLGARGLTVDQLVQLLGPDDALSATARRVDPIALTEAVLAQNGHRRIPQLVQTIGDPTTRHAVSGLHALASGQAAVAGRELDAALARDPRNRTVRAALLLLRGRVGSRLPGTLNSLEPLEPEERTIIDAWAAAGRDGDRALAAFEQPLAAIGADHPLQPEALRLRARWRLAGTPEQALEALGLIDDAMASGPRHDDFLLRARIALAAGDPGEAIDSVEHVLFWMKGPSARLLGEQAIGVLDGFEAPGELGARRARVRARLEQALAGGAGGSARSS